MRWAGHRCKRLGDEHSDTLIALPGNTLGTGGRGARRRAGRSSAGPNPRPLTRCMNGHAERTSRPTPSDADPPPPTAAGAMPVTRSSAGEGDPTPAASDRVHSAPWVGKEDVVLRRRGKPSIRLALETRQVSTAAASAAVLARAEEAASILSAALDGVAELAAQLPELLARRYAWIRFLPTDGRSTFAREYVETLQACASIGNTARFEKMLCAWKATAEVYADPTLLAKLTVPCPRRPASASPDRRIS